MTPEQIAESTQACETYIASKIPAEMQEIFAGHAGMIRGGWNAAIESLRPILQRLSANDLKANRLYTCLRNKELPQRDGTGMNEEVRALMLQRKHFETQNTEMRRAIDLAWGIIANAGDGNWETQTPDWQAAAAWWRDTFVLDTGAAVVPLESGFDLP